MANWYQNLRTENAAILALTSIPKAEVTHPKEEDMGYDFEVRFRDLPHKGTALTVEVKGVERRPVENKAFRLKLTPKTIQYVRHAEVPVMLMIVYVPKTEFFICWLKEPTESGRLEVVEPDKDRFYLTHVNEEVLNKFAEAARSFQLNKAALWQGLDRRK